MVSVNRGVDVCAGSGMPVIYRPSEAAHMERAYCPKCGYAPVVLIPRNGEGVIYDHERTAR